MYHLIPFRGKIYIGEELILIFFLFIYLSLLIWRDSESARTRMGEGQRASQADSLLSVQEPEVGLHPMNHDSGS